MRKMKKVVITCHDGSYDSQSSDRHGSSYSFCEEIGRWKKNEDYCFIKRYRVYRTV